MSFNLSNTPLARANAINKAERITQKHTKIAITISKASDMGCQLVCTFQGNAHLEINKQGNKKEKRSKRVV